MNGQAIKRVRFLIKLFLFWAILLVGRLIQLQLLQHHEYVHIARKQQEKLVTLLAERGKILDRLGQPLAVSRPLDSVCVNPLRIRDKAFAADVLSNILNLDARTLLLKMQEVAADDGGFMWVKRRISEEESASLHSLHFEWIEYRTEFQRVYPEHSLAAQVVGSVDFDQYGDAGIEQSFDAVLQGHNGSLLMDTDSHQDGFQSQFADPPRPGRDVRLTIDTRIQRIAEEELLKTIHEHRCKTGSIVVLDPKTGDILAMASYPFFDPNVPVKKGEDLSPRTNQAITVPFEPGSVLKVVTLSTALETTRLTPDSMINCGMGSITVAGRTVHEDHRFGMLSMEDVLVHSSNVGAIRVGLVIGAPKLYEYMTARFQLGKRTGIPLPGESPGLVHSLKNWSKVSMGSLPMGHEMMATTLQLAQAGAIIANNGFYVRPRITLDTPLAKPIAALNPNTAFTMQRMMENVILRGTGKTARLLEYTGGGKTGTAQIVDLNTHRYTHSYNASFLGFAPVNNPRLVVIVSVNGASGKAGYGAEVSAPVFKQVMATALHMRDVPPDVPVEPRVTSIEKPEPGSIATREGEAPEKGPATNQQPETSPLDEIAEDRLLTRAAQNGAATVRESLRRPVFQPRIEQSRGAGPPASGQSGLAAGNIGGLGTRDKSRLKP